jgi:uncharacterized RDD family membrane protein YckC
VTQPADPTQPAAGYPPPPPGYVYQPQYTYPQQYTHQPQYYAPYGGATLASWGLRAVGALIDYVIVGVLIGVLVGFAHPANPGAAGEAFGRVLPFTVPILWGFFNGATGQTPGKKLMKIRLLRQADGQPLGVGMGVLRGLCHVADTLPIFIGWLWPLWNGERQTFADKIVRAVVVKA